MFSIELHELIEGSVRDIAEKIENGSLSLNLLYPPMDPPDKGFTDAEKEELKKLEENSTLKSDLKKAIADGYAATVFHLLNIIDGTSSPYLTEWKGFKDNWGMGICLNDIPIKDDSSYHVSTQQSIISKFNDETSWDRLI